MSVTKAIQRTALTLFVEEGFTHVSLESIAHKMALPVSQITPFYPSSTAILESLIQALRQDFDQLGAAFFQETVVPLQRLGSLTITQSAWQFANNDALQRFLIQLNRFESTLLDFALTHSTMMQLLVQLGQAPNSACYHRLYQYLYKFDNPPLFRMHWQHDLAWTHTKNTTIRRFYFAMLPLIQFAAHFDQVQTGTQASAHVLKAACLSAFQTVAAPKLDGLTLPLIPLQTDSTF